MQEDEMTFDLWAMVIAFFILTVLGLGLVVTVALSVFGVI